MGKIISFGLIFLVLYTPLQGQWFWQNPTPQGNELLAIQMLNSETGYSVGVNGTIIKTIDGGKKWEILNSGTKMALLDVCFIDEDNGWAAGQWGTILRTTNGGLNWLIQNSSTSVTLKDVYFADSNTGWAVGGLITQDNQIIKTTNGGKTWIPIYTEACVTYPLSSIFWFDPLNILVAGSNEILKTTDGGESWLKQTLNPEWTIYSVSFPDQYTGWAAGVGLLLRSNDGGVTWTEYKNITGLSDLTLTSIKFINSNTGLITCGNGSCYKTTDRGEEWVHCPANIKLGLNSAALTDELTYWAVGETGAIRKTTDGGKNWVYQSGTPMGTAHSLYFLNKNTGWAAGYQFNSSNSFIAKTTNGGEDWIEQTTNFHNGSHSIFFINETTGWIVGNSNTAAKTTDGGNTWTDKIVNISVPSCGAFYCVFFTDIDNGYIAGENGTIINTTNGGNSWNIQYNGSGPRLASIYFINKNVGWVTGNNGVILKTTNGGLNWSLQPSNSDSYINKVAFFNKDTGWALSGRAMLTTKNGGNSWEKQDYPFGVMHAAAFPTPNTGWVTATMGDIFYMYGVIAATTDGGKTWALQDPPSDTWFNDIFFIDEKTGWVSGQQGIILKTNSGGFITKVDDNVPGTLRFFSLSQNYPNPFNPSTKICYSVSRTCLVVIKVYDILGRELATLVNEEKKAGDYEYDFHTTSLSSGVYLYRMQADGFTETRKFIIIK